jgi:F0F1-type ATP synthase membrane subunit c/vacuolar-type H+-ATPase subunit K
MYTLLLARARIAIALAALARLVGKDRAQRPQLHSKFLTGTAFPKAIGTPRRFTR